MDFEKEFDEQLKTAQRVMAITGVAAIAVLLSFCLWMVLR